MSQLQEIFNSCDSRTRKIFEISKCDHLSLVLSYENKDGLQIVHATYAASSDNRTTNVIASNDRLVYAMGSLLKVFIAVAMSLVIDVLSERPDATPECRAMKDVWNKPFTAVFKSICRNEHPQLPTIPGNPSVRQVLLHSNSFPDINHELLAPDGSHLLSMDEFIRKTVPQYSEHARGVANGDEVERCEYSNANYIVVARLIELVLGPEMTLSNFLKDEVFLPLGMTHTYLTSEDISSLPNDGLALPHVVSSDGSRRRVRAQCPNDTVELAAFGGYTCASDMDLFFRALTSGLSQIFPFDFPHTLYAGITGFDITEKNGYKLPGLLTTLDSPWPGSQSLNRLISPEGGFSKHAPGKILGHKEVAAYYLAGSITGGCNTIYYLPEKRLNIIVLTNTSAPVDASDIVSRLLLQEFLDLRPAESVQRNYHKLLPKREIDKADYVELTAKLFKENARIMKKVEEDDSVSDTKTIDCPYILGVYINRNSGQIIRVIDQQINEDGQNNRVLRITMSTGSKHSREMRFVQIGGKRVQRGRSKPILSALRNGKKHGEPSQLAGSSRDGSVFRICSVVREGYIGLAIDCFKSWKNLEFVYHEQEGSAYLSRKRESFLDVFERVE